MTSQKMVADRLRSAQKVIEVVRTQGETLAAGLRSRLQAPDYDPAPTLTHIAAAITRAADDLQAAMIAHTDELADDAAPRAARDEYTEALLTGVVRMRRAIGGVYGGAALEALGQAGRLDRRPDRALIAAETLMRKAPEVLPGRSGDLGLQVDPAQVIATLEGPAAALKAALGDVTREAREAELTLLARNVAMATYDAIFTEGATALAALFRLAGLPEHAARVRPSGRRPGRVMADDVVEVALAPVFDSGASEG